ncbi:hypothetical protein [Denitratisoma oestradiolicum]|uniref:hypothetical protein n=1 Tax=Denitratisoma oestradiolicum TaxID=311182 RepID=UPI001E2FC09F|nr:hypothetical protein [Denitratisoma oestradiolicum]
MQTAQADTTTQATDYPQWVIVENAGTDTEDVERPPHVQGRAEGAGELRRDG